MAIGRTGCGRTPRTVLVRRHPASEPAQLGSEHQVERFEPERDLVDGDVEHGRDRPLVVLADREHAPVEVLALDLDHAQEPGEHLERCARQLRELEDVDRQLRSRPGALGAARVVGTAGQELVDRHPVELRQPVEPGQRQGALAAFVGAQHRRLELLRGLRLDVMQRQPLLLADRPQPFTYLCAVAGIVVLDFKCITHWHPLPPACFRPINVVGARYPTSERGKMTTTHTPRVQSSPRAQSCAVSSAPATTAAVSTRSTVCPSDTRSAASASSSGDHPPSGPIASASIAPGQRPSVGLRHRRRPAARRRPAPGRRCRAARLRATARAPRPPHGAAWRCGGRPDPAPSARPSVRREAARSGRRRARSASGRSIPVGRTSGSRRPPCTPRHATATVVASASGEHLAARRAARPPTSAAVGHGDGVAVAHTQDAEEVMGGGAVDRRVGRRRRRRHGRQRRAGVARAAASITRTPT